MTVLVIGLILLAAAGVLTADVVTNNTSSVHIDLWGASVNNVSLGLLFAAGLVTAAVAIVGITMLMAAARRTRRLRAERRELRRENQRLAQQVEAPPAAPEQPVRPLPADQVVASRPAEPLPPPADRTEIESARN